MDKDVPFYHEPLGSHPKCYITLQWLTLLGVRFVQASAHQPSKVLLALEVLCKRAERHSLQAALTAPAGPS